MSRFLSGNLYLVASMFCVTTSHVMIKGLIDQAQPESFAWRALGQFLTVERLIRGGIAGVLLVAGFVTWMLCLTRLDLSYAYPVASTSVLLISLFSVLVLGETVTPRMWLGTALILVGVVLLRPER